MINEPQQIARRRFVNQGALSLSALATTWLLHREARGEPTKPDLDRSGFDLRPKPTHHQPRATAMISPSA